MTKEMRNNAKDRATARSLLPLVALGGGLATAPAAALELGELSVHSNLGQPLRASIAYALAPNEMLSNTCVSVSSGRSTSGLPGIGANSVRITERAIMISGQSPIREPMLATRVTIDCPYTPNLSREYMLLVDPPHIAATRAPEPAANVPAARPEPAPVARPEPAPVARTEPAPVARTEPAPASRPATQAPPRRAPVDNTPIGQSTRYQVQPGDSLSEIVARIENRSVKLWPAVNMVFAANPDAFIDNDPNLLKAGSWLTIPSLDGTAPIVNAATTEPVTSPAETPAPAADTSASAEDLITAYDSVASDKTGRVAEEPVVAEEPAVAEEPVVADEPVVSDSTADLMPGDVIIDNTLTRAEETIVIPDTELEGPETASSSPNVPTAIVSTGTRSESTSLLTWLIGGGLALILALLLFGRRARDRFSAEPAMEAVPVADDDYEEPVVETDLVASDSAMEVETAMHFDIDDDSPTDENLALDADLVVGTGLDDGELADRQDFGFAQTTELDIELPYETAATTDDSIIEPISIDEMDIESVLEDDMLPESDDGSIMSIAPDALDTVKMPQPDVEETVEDLRTLDLEDSQSPRNITINEEIGVNLLEQDYEAELTATQAFNREIEMAAAELASGMKKGETEEETSKMPLATVTELDATAEMRREGLDATAEMRRDGDEATAEFESAYDPDDTNALTISMQDEEKTNRMPVANDDDTVEMDIESGTVDTRKRSRKS